LGGELTVAQGPGGEVALLDTTKPTVRVSSASSQYERTIASPGLKAVASDIAADQASGDILVEVGSCVYRYHSDRAEVVPSVLSPQHVDERYLVDLTGIAAGPNGTIYAGNRPNGLGPLPGASIYELSPTNAVIRQITSANFDPMVPYGVGSDGTVYYPDRTGRIARITAEGMQLPDLPLAVVPATVEVYGSDVWVLSGNGSSSELTDYDLSGTEVGAPIPISAVGVADRSLFAPRRAFAVGPSGIDVETAAHQILQCSAADLRATVGPVAATAQERRRAVSVGAVARLAPLGRGWPATPVSAEPTRGEPCRGVGPRSRLTVSQ
jgi:hypothetical protein